MAKNTSKICCPNCEESLPEHADVPFSPFCSERCKMNDLNNWFSGNYSVPGPPVPPEHLPGLDEN